jgi:hypothetical protein
LCNALFTPTKTFGVVAKHMAHNGKSFGSDTTLVKDELIGDEAIFSGSRKQQWKFCY